MLHDSAPDFEVLFVECGKVADHLVQAPGLFTVGDGLDEKFRETAGVSPDRLAQRRAPANVVSDL